MWNLHGSTGLWQPHRRDFCCSVLVPLLTYWLYPPEVKEGAEVTEWAAKEVAKLGGLTSQEITLGCAVAIALVLWIFAGDDVNATTAALVVICLMVILNVAFLE